MGPEGDLTHAEPMLGGPSVFEDAHLDGPEMDDLPISWPDD